MQVEVGFVFQDPKTGFTWRVSRPWVSRWRKRQLGWICKRAGFHPLQDPVSNWYACDIINALQQAESKENPRLGRTGERRKSLSLLSLIKSKVTVTLARILSAPG